MNMTQDTTKTVASPSGLQRVTVLGTGVLGAQIAFQCAFHGKSVTAYDIDAAALERARDALTRLAQTYSADLPGTTPEATTRVAAAIALSSDLAQAVRDAALRIERGHRLGPQPLATARPHRLDRHRRIDRVQDRRRHLAALIDLDHKAIRLQPVKQGNGLLRPLLRLCSPNRLVS